METPLFKPLGTDVDLLDTPSLVVDVSILDQNIESMHSFFRGVKANLRPHVESHRCPSIARKQIADNDDSVEGIAVSSLSQAEVFSNAGFGDIFITNMIVTPQKISRLCALARKTKVTVCVDNKINVISLSQAAFINQVNLQRTASHTATNKAYLLNCLVILRDKNNGLRRWQRFALPLSYSRIYS